MRARKRTFGGRERCYRHRQARMKARRSGFTTSGCLANSRVKAQVERFLIQLTRHPRVLALVLDPALDEVFDPRTTSCHSG